jgi:hypothetical protein
VKAEILAVAAIVLIVGSLGVGYFIGINNPSVKTFVTGTVPCQIINPMSRSDVQRLACLAVPWNFLASPTPTRP